MRHNPLSAVLVTNADVDHVAGLLSLREAQPLPCTPPGAGVLDANAIFNVVNREHVPRRPVQLNESMPILDAAGEATGICIETFTVPGKVALCWKTRMPSALAAWPKTPSAWPSAPKAARPGCFTARLRRRARQPESALQAHRHRAV